MGRLRVFRIFSDFPAKTRDDTNILKQKKTRPFVKYSQSPPCDHSRMRPALVTTGTVKARLTCHFQ